MFGKSAGYNNSKVRRSVLKISGERYMRLYYYRWKMALLAGLMGIAVLSTGCSRSTMNYQLAESLGTVGKYENNEPV